MRRVRPLVLAAALCSLAVPAWAEGPIATAAAAGAPDASSNPPPAPIGRPRFSDPTDDRVRMGPCGPEAVGDDGKVAHKPHGEVGVAVGTGGYRSVEGAICQPLGDNGAVMVAVDASRGDAVWGRRGR
ncbi:MAG: hypothetical protein WDM92_10840 [Caulobacteraceae bacterium]